MFATYLPINELANVLLLSCIAASSLSSDHDRRVAGHTLVSDTNPSITLTLPATTLYIGRTHWLLKRVADCDLFVFIEPGKSRVVHRLWWIQFEGFLATKPELQYSYDMTHLARLGNMKFAEESWSRESDEQTSPDSDREQMQSIVRKAGYSLPKSMTYARLVHPLEPDHRKELMIIYAEDNTQQVLNLNRLSSGRTAAPAGASFDSGVVARAEQSVTVIAR